MKRIIKIIRSNYNLDISDYVLLLLVKDILQVVKKDLLKLADKYESEDTRMIVEEYFNE
jgi:hypothetical protein